MRTIIAFCVVVIAVASVADAVENVYGWNNVKPAAARAWESGKGWYDRLLGPAPQTAEAPAAAHPFGPAVAAPSD